MPKMRATTTAIVVHKSVIIDGISAELDGSTINTNYWMHLKDYGRHFSWQHVNNSMIDFQLDGLERVSVRIGVTNREDFS